MAEVPPCDRSPAVPPSAGHRLAVVTGAGRGIGRHIALGLAAAGWEVVLVARSADQLAGVRDEIIGAGGRAHAVPTDVSCTDRVAALAAAVAAIGPAGVLVNAAGIFGPLRPFAETDPETWLDVLRVNVFGAVLVTRALLPAMLETGSGRILTVSSAASLHSPGPLNSAYGTSKAALNQFTRHLAAEIAGSGVTANVFHPGDVRTDMWAAIRDEVAAVGRSAEDNYGPWVRWVDETGGDPPSKAVDLVLAVLAAEPGPNGEFLWIADPLQQAVPSWDVEPEPPSYTH